MYAMKNDDPFKILNLTPDPNLDKKAIKRAYKRMALKYHPDVLTNKDSTEEEKRMANDNFAKINWAYEILTGKNKDQAAATTSSTGGYTPPHRRTSTSYTSGSQRPTGGVSWEDFMPKYDESEYDTDGDSFSAIFSDLFTGAAGAVAGGAVGGAGILTDLIDFLEGNVEGYSDNARNDDTQLSVLLQRGSVEDIGMEMDDTELVVKQLSSKLDNLNQELMTLTAQADLTSRYLERLELEESMEELKARKKVSEGYLKKARKRLVKLQTRYKELIVGGQSDPVGGGRSRRQNNPTRESSSHAADRPSSEQKSTSRAGDDEDAWKNQGFGSTGRARGSGRRRSRRGRMQAEEVEYSSSKRTTPGAATSSTTKTTTSSSTKSPSQSTRPYQQPVPPHRRTQSQTMSDKKRLRELKVDEDFDQLKRDLGL